MGFIRLLIPLGIIIFSLCGCSAEVSQDIPLAVITFEPDGDVSLSYKGKGSCQYGIRTDQTVLHFKATSSDGDLQVEFKGGVKKKSAKELEVSIDVNAMSKFRLRVDGLLNLKILSNGQEISMDAARGATEGNKPAFLPVNILSLLQGVGFDHSMNSAEYLASDIYRYTMLSPSRSSKPSSARGTGLGRG